jgi:hypothetical protein
MLASGVSAALGGTCDPWEYRVREALNTNAGPSYTCGERGIGDNASSTRENGRSRDEG